MAGSLDLLYTFGSISCTLVVYLLGLTLQASGLDRAALNGALQRERERELGDVVTMQEYDKFQKGGLS